MFDLARFTRLARAQFAEQGRGWLWFLAIVVMLHFLALLLTVSGYRGFLAVDLDQQRILFFTGLFLTAPIFAGRYFQGMARRESAGVLLMRPASPFEKWLLAVGVVVVLYPLAYALVYQICNVPAGLYAQHLRTTVVIDPDDPARVWWELQSFGVLTPGYAFRTAGSFTTTALWLVTLQGFALLGSLYFQRLPIIKTVVTGFVIMLLVILMASVLDSRVDTFFGWWFEDDRPGGWRDWFMPFAWFAVPGLLWLGALFGLRERQVP